MDLLKIRYSQLRTDKDQIKRVTKNKKSEPLIRYGPSLNKSNEFYNLLKKISLSQDR